MVYQGSGGPPPSASTGSTGGSYTTSGAYGYHLYETLKSGKRKKVGIFRVNPGEKNVPFVFLDEALPSVEAAPSIRIHDGFRYHGKYGNSVICVQHREGGCLLDQVLETEHRCFKNCPKPCPKEGTNQPMKGSWRWVATGIKMKEFTYKHGPLKGTTVPYQRCLLLVPVKQYEEFMVFREKFEDEGGLRGKVFHITRQDKQTSSKIGTTWFPAGQMSDAELHAKFEKAAADYGLPVEDYCQPYNYEEVLKEFDDDEILKIAKSIAEERRIKLEGHGDPAPVGASSSSDAADEGSEDEVPF